jgi:hypothetical protein
MSFRSPKSIVDGSYAITGIEEPGVESQQQVEALL